MQEGSKYCETSAYCDDGKIQVKSRNDQINFLTSKIKSKIAITKMNIDDHKNELGQPKPIGNRRENNIG